MSAVVVLVHPATGRILEVTVPSDAFASVDEVMDNYPQYDVQDVRGA